MNLRIACEETAPPPPPDIQINFGKSSQNRRCVDAPSPVACAVNAGNRGKRVNTDYRNAGDAFEIAMEGRQVCARRLDRTDLGWGMNLQIKCPAADAFPEPAAAAVEVLIGKSPGNRKCVNAPGPVACDSDAGDQGIRINSDYAGAGDSFDIDVDGSQVCVRRTDQNRGWGMNLKIACVEAAPPPPAPVQINFGKSSQNRRCVDAPSPVACAVDAGNRGKRVNTDYRSAG